MVITILFVINLLYGMNSGGRSRLRYRATDIQELVHPILFWEREFFTVGMQNVCFEVFKQKGSTKTLESPPTWTDIKKITHETECPIKIAHILATFINKPTISSQFKPGQTLFQYIESVYSSFIKSNYDESAITEAIDEVTKTLKFKRLDFKGNERILRESMREMLPGNVVIDNIISDIAQQIETDNHEIVNPHHPNPLYPFKYVPDGWEIPTVNYDFDTVQWTSTEIATASQEKQKQMKVDNKEIQILKEMHRLGGKEWKNKVTQWIYFRKVKFTKKANDWFRKWGADTTMKLALITYTDNEKIQKDFRKTFRGAMIPDWNPRTAFSGIVSIKKLRQFFIIFKTALQDAFALFTKAFRDGIVTNECNHDDHELFYHGFSDLCFDYVDDFVNRPFIKMMGPLSTTTKEKVADLFSVAYQGIMITVKKYPNCKYEPIPAWHFSSFANEKECMFFSTEIIPNAVRTKVG
eukprot:161461_1